MSGSWDTRRCWISGADITHRYTSCRSPDGNNSLSVDAANNLRAMTRNSSRNCGRSPESPENRPPRPRIASIARPCLSSKGNVQGHPTLFWKTGSHRRRLRPECEVTGRIRKAHGFVDGKNPCKNRLAKVPDRGLLDSALLWSERLDPHHDQSRRRPSDSYGCGLLP